MFLFLTIAGTIAGAIYGLYAGSQTPPVPPLFGLPPVAEWALIGSFLGLVAWAALELISGIIKVAFALAVLAGVAWLVLYYLGN